MSLFCRDGFFGLSAKGLLLSWLGESGIDAGHDLLRHLALGFRYADRGAIDGVGVDAGRFQFGIDRRADLWRLRTNDGYAVVVRHNRDRRCCTVFHALLFHARHQCRRLAEPLDFRDLLFPKVTPGHGHQAALGFTLRAAITADFQNLLRKTALPGDGCGCVGEVVRVCRSGRNADSLLFIRECRCDLLVSLRRSRQRCGVGHVGGIRHCQWITLIDLGVELRLRCFQRLSIGGSVVLHQRADGPYIFARRSIRLHGGVERVDGLLGVWGVEDVGRLRDMHGTGNATHDMTRQCTHCCRVDEVFPERFRVSVFVGALPFHPRLDTFLRAFGYATNHGPRDATSNSTTSAGQFDLAGNGTKAKQVGRRFGGGCKRAPSPYPGQVFPGHPAMFVGFLDSIRENAAHFHHLVVTLKCSASAHGSNSIGNLCCRHFCYCGFGQFPRGNLCRLLC